MVFFCFLVDQRRTVRSSKPAAGICSRCRGCACVADMETATRFCYVRVHRRAWRAIICSFCGAVLKSYPQAGRRRACGKQANMQFMQSNMVESPYLREERVNWLRHGVSPAPCNVPASRARRELRRNAKSPNRAVAAPPLVEQSL
ncbi:hypothetical protein Taro_039133 [Colocasia esculenta]|uniref:Uncharacterized protein n=1 Tax=Colocasia esculenta TaxID=4460 RepID=A0A843WPA0_COLES|nr:hypothetical protein [Colocasia esculenta]